MKHYQKLYRSELFNEVIPWWQKYSPDAKNGGYFTCITDAGKIFDTDKFIWLQARQIWMFSKLYIEIEPNAAWLNMAQSGIDFLEKYGRDKSGHWYFSLTRDGKPLVQPYNIFSDCFAAMAFGTFYQIQPESRYSEIALDTFNQILKRQENPKGSYNKIYPGTRNIQNFALPMILCNLSLELEHLLGSTYVDDLTDRLIDLILGRFYHQESGLILENIGENGRFIDSFEGRLLNPGHAIEAMWFLMNLGLRKKDDALVNKAAEIIYRQLEHGWDKEYTGIFYFMDFKGHPPQQLEWDQKLWWVHLESLIALAKIYSWNQSERARYWFEKVHDYAWNHFRDQKRGGEWYGYLNRRGEVLLQLKGGKWKGCFHVPRALLEVSKTLEKVDI